MGNPIKIEVLMAESPFFIVDVCAKHHYAPKSLWNYIKYHAEKFSSEKVPTNKRGRPPKRYTVI